MDTPESSPKLEELPSKRVAKIRVSIPLLNNLLPAGSTVLGVQANEYFDVVELIVEHPSFEPVRQGDWIPLKMVLFYKESHEDHSWISKVEYSAS